MAQEKKLSQPRRTCTKPDLRPKLSARRRPRLLAPPAAAAAAEPLTLPASLAATPPPHVTDRARARPSAAAAAPVASGCASKSLAVSNMEAMEET